MGKLREWVGFRYPTSRREVRSLSAYYGDGENSEETRFIRLYN